MANTSDRLKEAMNLRQLKQIDLVEITGINKGALSSYISGRYLPKQTNIYKLAKALDVNEAWLMGLDVPIERTHISTSEEKHSHPISLKEQRLLKSFNKLNALGQDKVIEYSEDLLSNYRYTVETMAAHNDYASDPEQQRLMKEDLEDL